MNEAAVGVLNELAQGRAGRKPLQNAPGAKESLIWAIVGFFICGFIMGPIAIVKANQAKKAIAADPQRYSGAGLADAAMVIGIIDTILHVVFLFVKVSGIALRR
jgi:hypothetical protein